MKIPIRFLFITTTLFISSEAQNALKLVREWKELEFQFPDQISQINAQNKREYIRGESLPIDVDVFYNKGGKTKIFVTIPRWGPGRPFTLATVNNEPNTNINLLQPYPDYSWHVNQGSKCAGMTSVFRIAIDECQRLWVLDTGKIGDDKLCPAQLLVFDLHSDTLIHRHYIADTSVRQHSLLVTPVVDVRDPHLGCRDTFVYMADVTGYGMVVYDFANDKTWRVDNKLMYPFPTEGTINVQGDEFDLMDGVLGMGLSPLRGSSDRILYFHSLASITENYVKTSILRNATAWENGSSADPRNFRVFKQKRHSQSAAEGMDRNGVLFFGLLEPCSIACWNSNTDYAQSNMHVIAHDHQTLQFPSGVKIVNNLKGEQELWILSCRLQKVMTGTISMNEINFRIQAGKIHKLIKNTKCERAIGSNYQSVNNQNNLLSNNQSPFGRVFGYGANSFR